MLRTLAEAACAAWATGSPEDACRSPTMTSRWQWLSNTCAESGSGGAGSLVTRTKVTPMRFAILGTTRAWRADGAEVGLGGPARRALLACLLLAAGEPMPRDRLIDLLYGEEPPENAGHALQAQVSRLRRSGIPVVLSPAGYLRPAEPEAVDGHRFPAPADAGRQALNGDEAAPAAPGRAGPARAAALLREALALWAEPADVPARLVPP